MSDEENQDPGEKKVERYNTQYLVSSIQKEQSRTKTMGFIALGILVAALVYFLFIRQPAKDEPPPGAASTEAPK